MHPVVITEINDNHVIYTDGVSSQVKESFSTFSDKWTGIALLAEKGSLSGEADFTTKQQAEIRKSIGFWVSLIGIVLTVGVLGWRNIQNYNKEVWYTFFTKLLGTAICTLLITRQFNRELTNRICKIGSKDGCTGVLDSPAAHLTTWLSWSEIGFFYFLGGLLIILFSSHIQATLNLFYLISILSIPFVGYSIYYQGIVARSWCILCLSVLLIFVLDFSFTLIFSESVNSLFQIPSNFFDTAICFILPIMFYIIIQPLIEKYQQSYREDFLVNKIKYDPHVFTTLLKKQEKAPNWIPDRLIEVGESNAVHTITIVTNPFCEPCTKAYREIKYYVEKNELINCKLIFSIYNEQDKVANIAQEVFDEDIRDYETVLQKTIEYRSQSVTGKSKIKSKENMIALNQHFKWCQEAKIVETPTIFINGFKMPTSYSIQEALTVLRFSEVAEEVLVTT
jgi:uncharacterized membrane protein/glutaredoxin